MRSLIVGTAGHIDHGKSALVRALTGTDPDRLKEEKERGITIDLGFANLDLGDGLVASFIDVPGHERFVRNMLAGAHGIDAVMLVIAADESVMPQTREHFDICRLLGVRAGIVALTKCDLVDEETLALAEMEAVELVSGSFLEAASLLRVSSRTGAGLAEVRSALARLAASAHDRPARGLARLPVDRSFTLRGFGTVVTGTLVSGSLGVGEEMELLPSGRRARVRGLQIHGAAVDRATAGHRTAVNLAGVEVADVSRGDVLVRPGTLEATSVLDVAISLLPAARPLANHARVRVHVASAEVMARLVVTGSQEIAPGSTARGQLRLERPAVASWGDRLILRSYSPAVTIGGAQVVDPHPPRRRRREAPARVDVAHESPAQAAARMIRTAGASGISAAGLAARLTLSAADLAELLADEEGVVALGREGFIAREAAESLARSVVQTLERFHAENPLRAAMPKEELRRGVFARSLAGAFEHVLSRLEAEARIGVSGESVRLAGHEVRLTQEEEQARSALIGAALAAGLAGVEASRLPSIVGHAGLAERVSRLLQAEATLCRVGDGLVHQQPLETLKTEVRRRWPPGSRLDVGELKELTGLSRKYVIPLLEYLDRERVTRRAGENRVVLGGRA